MARRKLSPLTHPTLTLPPPSQDVDADVLRLADDLAARIAAIGDIGARVDALNAVRAKLHEASPFAREPVDLVLWRRNDLVRGNDYNPNKVAPPEMKLLRRSIEEDGYTQPIVGWPSPDDAAVDEVVDGFHRSRVGTEPGAIRTRVHGYLPVVRLSPDRHGRGDRIAATIRHNRARGVHGVNPMSDVVRLLVEAGWPDDKIQAELGMDLDEVVRLKQLTGLAALFRDREFSEAWDIDGDPRGDDPEAPESVLAVSP